MFKFNKPKSQAKYATERDYLKAVYYKNRSELIKTFGSDKTLTKFINNIQAQKATYGLTTRQALNKLAASESFTPEVERLHDNVYKAMKSYGRLPEFRELSKIRGRYSKYDPNQLKWDNRNKIYIYAGKITIDLTNSPKDVILGVI